MDQFVLPSLPFGASPIEGLFSEETLHFHHGVHFKNYLDTAKKLSEGTEFAVQSLGEITIGASGALQRNAAQALNHDFYFKCISREKTAVPETLSQALSDNFSSVEKFREDFISAAINNFGSGWTWLIQSPQGLRIYSTSNAGNPITSGFIPLLCVDVWEHAYYIDFRNRRADYLKAFFEHINWNFVAGNLK